MFPNLLKPERLNFVTNPHEFCINGVRFLGTDGNNVKDIRMFAENHRNPVEIMEHMLQCRHICPTSPDTLRSYPFTTTDPFIIKSAPHVFFAGNQPVYGAKWVNNDTTMVVSVPAFYPHRQFVLLDLQTLDTYPYQIDCTSLVGELPGLNEIELQRCESGGQIEFEEDAGGS
jgi:DNA polymerase delta subunit 2